MSINPRETPEGAIRYNTDSNKMEVWIGDKWKIVSTSSPNLDGGARGVFFGGAPSNNAAIDFITISTAGDAGDFGDMTSHRVQGAAGSSNTRGVYGNGEAPSITDRIEFITFSSTGDAQDFGDTTDGRRRANGMGLSNQTRALFNGGYSPGTVNTIDFITIASTGNAKDYGDLTVARESGACCASPIRGIISGGRNQPANTPLNSIDFVDGDELVSRS